MKSSSVTASVARIDIDRYRLRKAFDKEPLGFSHTLSELGLFKIEALHALSEKMAEHRQDYFVASTAPSPGTDFFSVPGIPYKPPEAIERLDTSALRILLKRAENHDQSFRDLINTLFEQVVEYLPDLVGQKIVRLESGILISSAATITPFHFDPEIGFFSQIQGQKIYHVYSPTVITEKELEESSLANGVMLTPIDLAGRDPAREYVFDLFAGQGFHQPHSAPHWVQTGADRSISYTFVFETEATRARTRIRAFNHYMRRMRLTPAAPGSSPGGDAVKSLSIRAINATSPLRRLADRVLKSVVDD